MTIYEWTHANWTVIATILFLLSELLAQIPSVKANSIFQVILGFLKKEKEEADKKPQSTADTVK